MMEEALRHEQKTDMLFRAMFGERDPKTLRRKLGVQDIQNIQTAMLLFLTAQALGVPTTKLFEGLSHFFTASAGVLVGK
jgi:hypothetical protein